MITWINFGSQWVSVKLILSKNDSHDFDKISYYNASGARKYHFVRSHMFQNFLLMGHFWVKLIF